MLCCYHPTTVIAIDDDKDFLMAVSQHLALPNFRFFTSPLEALQSLNNKNSFKRIKSKLMKTTSYSDDIGSTPEQYAILVNFKQLHEEIYSAERFEDASVLIIDYHMGEINGIDVCQQLANHPAKKILLTGGADKEKVAIEAFNKGIIHRFINKSDLNFPTQLKHAITILQEAYFRELTTLLIPNTANTPLLQNASYLNFIRNLQAQLNAEEFYLLDTSGSILYLSQDSPTWLIIKNKDEIDSYANIAAEAEGPHNIIEAIKTYSKLPFFFSEKDYQAPVTSWDKYLYEAHALPGTNNYYYSVIHGDPFNNLKKDKIIPSFTASTLDVNIC